MYMSSICAALNVMVYDKVAEHYWTDHCDECYLNQCKRIQIIRCYESINRDVYFMIIIIPQFHIIN